jgi:hypothetical protein
MWSAGVPLVLAMSLVPAVQSVQDGRYTATGTQFDTAVAGGDYSHSGVVFTAPQSGRAAIYWSGAVRTSPRPAVRWPT